MAEGSTDAEKHQSVLHHFTLAMFPRLTRLPEYPHLQPPAGLQEILTDFSREVLRQQPKDVIAFACIYFEKQLEERAERELQEQQAAETNQGDEDQPPSVSSQEPEVDEALGLEQEEDLILDQAQGFNRPDLLERDSGEDLSFDEAQETSDTAEQQQEEPPADQENNDEPNVEDPGATEEQNAQDAQMEENAERQASDAIENAF